MSVLKRFKKNYARERFSNGISFSGKRTELSEITEGTRWVGMKENDDGSCVVVGSGGGY